MQPLWNGCAAEWMALPNRKAASRASKFRRQRPQRHITLSEARSRLYQRRSLQVNRHFAAFFKIYKIFTILRRSNLKILQNFVKFFMTWKEKISLFFENVEQFSPKIWVPSGAKVCKSCRSWNMLKKDYLVAKIGVDTAENEPSKVPLRDVFVISLKGRCGRPPWRPRRTWRWGSSAPSTAGSSRGPELRSLISIR